MFYNRTGMKWWRNGPPGKWSCRIRWFEDIDDDDNIRLSMQDATVERNYFPHDREHAQKVWDLFIEQCPLSSSKEPFVNKFIDQIQKEENRP